MGEHPTVTYDHLLKLTRMKDVSKGIVEGLMNPDKSQNSLKGSIFEYWGSKTINGMTSFPFTTVPNVTLQRKNPVELNNLQNTNNKELTVDGYFRIPSSPNPLLVAVEFKYSSDDVPTYQLTDRNNIQLGVVSRFIYIFAQQPTANVISRIRAALINSEIYYFSINRFTKVP